jgi:hypothetical protein
MTKANPLPLFELLNELLRYEPETGHLTWKTTRGRAVEGQTAGWQNLALKSTTPYLKIQIDQKAYFAHRVAYCLHTGVDPLGKQVDHIDGNGLNNTWSNLRLASGSQNCANTGIRSSNTSGYKGVHYYKRNKKWGAIIRDGGRSQFLGLFSTPELAHMAYCKAAAELHGDFARGA